MMPIVPKISRVKINGGKDWLDVSRVPGYLGDWTIVGDSMTDAYNNALAMTAVEGLGAVNQDHSSDGMQCFGRSEHMVVGLVEFRGRSITGARRLTDLRLAAQALEWYAWDYDDI